MAAQATGNARKTIVIALALAAAVTALLTCFALPNANTGLDGLPVAVVAPADVAAQLEAGLDAAQPGAFSFVEAGSRDEAAELIENRDAYGAFVVSEQGHTLLVASAASPTIASALSQVAQGMASAQGVTIEVQDIVAFPEQDPKGAGLAAGALPIAVGGLLAGVAMTLLIPTIGRRAIAAATFSVVAGFAMMAVLRWWTGTFDGNYMQLALVASLGLAATAATVMGFAAALGKPGLALGGALIFAIGNPLSGVTNSPDLLPRPWGAVGQLLQPGATGTMLRNVGFFDGAATLKPGLVLAAWLILGAGLLALGWFRSRRAAQPRIGS